MDQTNSRAKYPRIKAASIEEVRGWFDPYLLDWREPSEDEERRYDELKTIFVRLRGQPAWPEVAGAMAEIERILTQGTFRHAWASNEDFNTYFGGYRAIAKSFSENLDNISDSEAERGIIFCLKLLAASRASGTRWIHYLVDCAYELILARAIQRWIRRTDNVAALTRVSGHILRASRQDSDLEQAVRGDLRYGFIPSIADPIGTLDSTGGLYSVLSPKWPTAEVPDRPFWAGSHDPKATAELLSPILLGMLFASNKTAMEVDWAWLRDAGQVANSLPRLPKTKLQPFRAVGEAIVRIKMDSIPNSVGKSATISIQLFESILRSSWGCRTSRELLRASLALKHYRLHHSLYPAHLSDLDLTPPPFDFYGNTTLKWLPNKEKLYSVGPDRRDSGGVFSEDLSFGGLDFGLSMQ